MARALILALVLVRCAPLTPLDDCKVTCGEDGRCPEGTTCDGQGFCRTSEGAALCIPDVEPPEPVDAGLPHPFGTLDCNSGWCRAYPMVVGTARGVIDRGTTILVADNQGVWQRSSRGFSLVRRLPLSAMVARNNNELWAFAGAFSLAHRLVGSTWSTQPAPSVNDAVASRSGIMVSTSRDVQTTQGGSFTSFQENAFDIRLGSNGDQAAALYRSDTTGQLMLRVASNQVSFGALSLDISAALHPVGTDYFVTSNVGVYQLDLTRGGSFRALLSFGCRGARAGTSLMLFCGGNLRDLRGVVRPLTSDELQVTTSGRLFDGSSGVWAAHGSLLRFFPGNGGPSVDWGMPQLTQRVSHGAGDLFVSGDRLFSLSASATLGASMVLLEPTPETVRCLELGGDRRVYAGTPRGVLVRAFDGGWDDLGPPVDVRDVSSWNDTVAVISNTQSFIRRGEAGWSAVDAGVQRVQEVVVDAEERVLFRGISGELIIIDATGTQTMLGGIAGLSRRPRSGAAVVLTSQGPAPGATQLCELPSATPAACVPVLSNIGSITGMAPGGGDSVLVTTSTRTAMLSVSASMTSSLALPCTGAVIWKRPEGLACAEGTMISIEAP